MIHLQGRTYPNTAPTDKPNGFTTIAIKPLIIAVVKMEKKVTNDVKSFATITVHPRALNKLKTSFPASI